MSFQPKFKYILVIQLHTPWWQLKIEPFKLFCKSSTLTFEGLPKCQIIQLSHISHTLTPTLAYSYAYPLHAPEDTWGCATKDINYLLTHDWSLTKYLQVYLVGTPLPTSIHGEPNRVPLHKTYTERPSTTQWAGLAVCQEWTRSTVSAHWDIEWQQPGPTDSQPHFGNSLPHFGNVLPPFHQYVCLWMFGLNVDLLWMWKVAHWCLKNLWQDLATPGVCCFVAQRLVAEFL